MAENFNIFQEFCTAKINLATEVKNIYINVCFF